MIEYNTSFIDNKAIIGILRRSYNYVDKRLMDHGVRVAYIVSRLLRRMPDVNPVRLRDICFLAALHDVGAYKTEEIDRMLQFETENIWEHSIYGYLFVKNFTPLREMAPAVLYHHTKWNDLKGKTGLSEANKQIAQLIHIADRLDIWMNMAKRPYQDFLEWLHKKREGWFESGLIDLLEVEHFTFFAAEEIEQESAFQQMQVEVPFTHEEIHAYLRMVIYSIDFRSRHTVTHTMTTTSISGELAGFMKLDPKYCDQIVCGALLHDIGKIGIPVEILEHPGKLSPQAMAVMRTHVDITEQIFDDAIPLRIQQISLRHHEKLDGSGYPLGLRADDLSIGERIVALADIVSALSGTRSYKKAFDKERIISIIVQMKEEGLIDAGLVDCMTAHYDEIMERTNVRCGPVIEVYERLQLDYNTLCQDLAGSLPLPASH